MKILVINRVAKELHENGHKRHAKIREIFKNENVEIDIVCSDVDYIHNKKSSTNNNENIFLKCIISGDNILLRFLAQIEFSIRVLFISANKYSYVIGSSPDLFGALSAFFIARRAQKKFILEVRDIWPLSIKELVKLPIYPGYTLLKTIEIFLYKKSDKIISTIPYLDKYFHDIGISKYSQKILWVPQFNIGESIQPKLKERGKRYKILYCGSLRHNNHIFDLVDYVKFLKKSNGDFFDFHILGDGPQKKDILTNEYIFKIHKPIVEQDKLIKFISGFDLGIAYIKESRIYDYGISLNKIVDFIQAGIPQILIGIGKKDFFVKNQSIIHCEHLKKDFAIKVLELYNKKPQEINVSVKILNNNFNKIHHEACIKEKLKKIFIE